MTKRIKVTRQIDAGVNGRMRMVLYTLTLKVLGRSTNISRDGAGCQLSPSERANGSSLALFR